MPSRLSSLLVRDGIVSVKRMEKAFRRQVIYGGNLDTVLLEMGLIPEDRLAQYLALSSEIPPAARNELPGDVGELRKLIPEALAGNHRVVPLGMDDEAIRIAVHAPVNITALENLADILDQALQPLVTPEFRWHLWFGQVYGGKPLERFLQLSRELDDAARVHPVGKAATVIVSELNPESSGGFAAPMHLMTEAESRTVREAAAALAPVGPAHPTMRMPGQRPEGTSPGLAEEDLDIEPIAPPFSASPTTPVASLARALHSQGRHQQRRATMIGLTPARAATGEGHGEALHGPAEDDSDEAVTSQFEPQQLLAWQAGQAAGQRGATDATVVVAGPRGDTQAMVAVGRPGDTEVMDIPALDSLQLDADAVPEPLATVAGSIEAQPSRLDDSRLPAGQASVELADQTVETPVSLPVAASHEPTSRTPRVDADRNSAIPAFMARQLLAAAENRDDVFQILLRATRTRTRWAGLLTVQGGAAIGRTALAEPGLDVAKFSTVLIPLEVASPFRTALVSKQPYVGPLRGDEGLEFMLKRLGGTVPLAGLIMPIMVRERVVALLVAHRGERDLSILDVADVIALERFVRDALARVIMRHKHALSQTPPQGLQAVSASSSLAMGNALPHEVTAPVATMPLLEATPRDLQPSASRARAISIVAEPPRPIDELLEELASANATDAEDAAQEAMGRVAEVLAALPRSFPGPLYVDRFSVAGRTLKAKQYGPLLGLIVRLGVVVEPFLLERLAAPQRDQRYYAAVCLAELRPTAALAPLVERLFDHDFGVRAAALLALAGYPLRSLDHALVFARHAIHSEDPERVAAACHAVGELGDSSAVPDLLDAMRKGGRPAELARNAMVVLTRQDLGASERKWRKWWEDHRYEHRIEWLILALGHRDEPMRAAAIATLRHLTGEHFGYHADMAKRDRDAAEQRWREWWQDTGRKRFHLRG